MTALLVAAALFGAAPRPAPAPPRILIVPFDTNARDGRTYWLGDAVSILMADDLNARSLGAIPRATRERAYEELHLPVHAVLSRATVIKVGELVGASEIIVGDVSLDGDALTIKARPIALDVGRAQPEIVEQGDLSDLFAVAQRVASRAVPGGSAAAPPGPPPSLQVFERYVKGLLAEQPAAQAEFLDAALRLDPHYDRARLALWDALTAQGDNTQALAAVTAVSDGSPDAPRARFLGGVSMLALKQYDQAFAAFKRLTDRAPDAAIWNDLGVIQLRRPPTPETGKPVYYFTMAADAEPDDPDLLFNLGYAYALDRDPQGAIYWLREALRRNPADAQAHLVLAAALDGAGSTVEAARERELAGQLSARGEAKEPLPRGLERVRQDLESHRDPDMDRAMASSSQRDQRDAAQFHLERGRRLYEAEQDREAMAELRRAVFLSPYEADAHLLIGRIHLRAGRPHEAVDALKISIWSRDTVEARLALADAYMRLKDTANARTEAEKALVLEPGNAAAKGLIARIDSGG